MWVLWMADSNSRTRGLSESGDCRSAEVGSSKRASGLRTAVLLLFPLLVLACASGTPRGAASRAIDPASPKGSLLIVGGGPIPDVILERFVTLAGGPGKARIVLYPMASEYDDAGVELAETFTRMGAWAERRVLTREQATESAAGELFGVTGIWFGGGDQSRLTAALLDTPVEAAIAARYRAGAVVGGTSAGAAVMSTPMLTGDEKMPGGDRPPAKDSSDAWMTIARENVVTARGFGLLPGAIVDQHFVRRRRNNRLLSLVLENPALVGVGIDESTAVEVGPDGIWRILGDSVAVVYDARRAAVTPAGAAALGASNVRLDVLPSGSTYDPRTATAVLPRLKPS
jgi:cyanophycinase